MKTAYTYFSLITIVLLLGFPSCKKKCVIEKENTDSGSIVKNVIFYPEAGHLTGSMGGNYVITASHSYADRFEVSINGAAKSPVNYSNYTILCYPVRANCNASYDRTVTIDNVNQTVVYKIVATQCSKCKEVYITENYVLVPAFPSNYAVSYDISYIDK